ncbi:hypothetical protein K505DRAFT_323069 [Melanomma pulvis-pyrius CBS 109.77]|uniref:Uncharacterized protein n=1 Tax=Melanomma pulvis-pyrius CBS 109.77 TaxID=1314802 RepID=A0A6A6XJM6_9PLEO|nr:hypothetical protein K505DRAFT_323069 [Melanomma pulvis-pyrius CBS 109.77]
MVSTRVRAIKALFDWRRKAAKFTCPFWSSAYVLHNPRSRHLRTSDSLAFGAVSPSTLLIFEVPYHRSLSYFSRPESVKSERHGDEHTD